MYRVFENGKRCDDHNIEGWVGKDTFTLKRNAEVYAFLWACPVSHADAEAFAPEMVIGMGYDYGMGEDCRIEMSIQEVDNV